MIDSLNAVAHGWWSWIAPLTLQAAILGGLVWTVDIALKRRAWPQVRYALWALVFVKLVLPPSFALPTSFAAHLLSSRPIAGLSEPARPAVDAPATAPRPAVGDDFSMLGTSRRADGRAVQPSLAISPAASCVSPESWAMLAWLTVAAGIAVWLLVRLVAIARIAGGELPAGWAAAPLAAAGRHAGLRRLPRIVVTPDIRSAAVFGLLRPAILMPASWERQYSETQTSHVLLHELMHIRRGDLAANAIQTALHLVFWFHPFVWLAGRRTRELRELCCDASVAQILGPRTVEYRQTLVEAGRRILAMKSPLSLGLLGLFENPARFRVRLEHLAGPLWKYRRLRLAASAVVVAAMMLFVLPMARLTAAQAGKSVPGSRSAAKAPAQPGAKAAAVEKVKHVLGTVKDPSGKAVSGVRVTAYEWGGDTDKPVAIEAASGEKGQFKMDLPVDERAKAWLLIGRAAGQIGFDVAPVEAGKTSSASSIEMLGAMGSISGKVKDTSGQAVAAKVGLVSLGSVRPGAGGDALTRIYDVRSLLSAMGSSDKESNKGADLAALIMRNVDQTLWNMPPESYVARYMDKDGGRLIVYAPVETQRKVQMYVEQLRLREHIDKPISSTVLDERTAREMQWPVARFPGAADDFTVNADTSGYYRIIGLPKGCTATIRCFGPGIGTLTQVATVGDEPHDFTVTTGATIRGRAESADPQTDLAGLSVSAIPRDFTIGGARQTVTASSGAFTFDGLAAGEYQVDVSSPTKRGIIERAPTTVVLAVGEAKDVVINVVIGGAVRGRIVDKDTHEPLEAGKASFTARGAKGGACYGGSVGADGKFEICLPPGLWTFTGIYTDEKGETVFDRDSEKDVEVAAGQDIEIGDLAVGASAHEKEEADGTPKARIAGRVVAEGEAADVSGILVIAHQRGPSRPKFKSATTARDGSFAIDRLDPGEYQISMNVSPERPFVEAEPTFVSVSAGKTADVEIQAVAGALVTGRVLNAATGQPIRAYDGMTLCFVRNGPSGGTLSCGANVDDTGSYRYRLAPDRWWVEAFTIGKDKQIINLETSRCEVTLKPGDKVIVPDITVTLPTEK